MRLSGKAKGPINLRCQCCSSAVFIMVMWGFSRNTWSSLNNSEVLSVTGIAREFISPNEEQSVAPTSLLSQAPCANVTRHQKAYNPLYLQARYHTLAKHSDVPAAVAPNRGYQQLHFCCCRLRLSELPSLYSTVHPTAMRPITLLVHQGE